MKKSASLFVLSLGISPLFSLAQSQEAAFDFDNGVHYRQTTLGDGHYRVEARPDDYKHFAKQSVFIFRHAKRLCKSSEYTLKVKDGVQDYDAIPTEPRPYPGALIVEIKC